MGIMPTGSKVLVSVESLPGGDGDDDAIGGHPPIRATVKGIGPEYGKKKAGAGGMMGPCCSHPPISVGDEVICRCSGDDAFDDGGEMVMFVNPDQIEGVVGGKNAKKLSKLVGGKEKESKSPVAEPDDDDGYSEETEMDE